MSTKLYIPAHIHITHSEREPGRWGAWEERGELVVGDIAHISPDVDGVYFHRHEVEYYEGELSIGDLVYVIIANYSSGDSFGRGYGTNLDICSIHKDEQTAHHNLAILRDSKINTIRLDDYFKPWGGYFESLDSIEVYTMIVGGPND